MGGLRTHMLYGFLGLVVVAWSLDFLAMQPTPQAAQALVAATLPEEGQAISADQMTAVLTALQAVPRERAPIELGQRNLFVQPAVPEPDPVLAARDAAPPSESASPTPTPTRPDLELGGIMTGQQKTAIINGRVYTRGQQVAGYTVRFIGRQHVLLRGPNGRIRLELSRPTLQAGNN